MPLEVQRLVRDAAGQHDTVVDLGRLDLRLDMLKPSEGPGDRCIRCEVGFRSSWCDAADAAVR